MTCPHPKSRKATRCRACQIAHLNSDPQVIANRNAAIVQRFSDPVVRDQARTRVRALTAAKLADPEQYERLREHGRRIYRDVLSRPDVIAKCQAPEVRARAGRKRTATVLGDIPPRLRAEYRRLKATKLIPAAEAKAIILAQYQKELDAVVAKGGR